MNKFDKIILFVFIVLFCGSIAVLYNVFSKKADTPDDSEKVQIFSDGIYNDLHVFNDGLKNSDSVTTYKLDRYGMGVSEKTIYYVDINGDSVPDRITKIFIETGNAHSYYKYKIELKSGNKYIDITPKNFQTTNGDTCDLQQIQFTFKPQFKVTLIYRELGDTWNTKTMAYKQDFSISKNNLIQTSKTKLKPVCDVKELF
jgi:hypothetical protein